MLKNSDTNLHLFILSLISEFVHAFCAPWCDQWFMSIHWFIVSFALKWKVVFDSGSSIWDGPCRVKSSGLNSQLLGFGCRIHFSLFNYIYVHFDGFFICRIRIKTLTLQFPSDFISSHSINSAWIIIHLVICQFHILTCYPQLSLVNWALDLNPQPMCFSYNSYYTHNSKNILNLTNYVFDIISN